MCVRVRVVCVDFSARHGLACVHCVFVSDRRKLKERVTQLDSENTALTRAHVER